MKRAWLSALACSGWVLVVAPCAAQTSARIFGGTEAVGEPGESILERYDVHLHAAGQSVDRWTLGIVVEGGTIRSAEIGDCRLRFDAMTLRFLARSATRRA